ALHLLDRKTAEVNRMILLQGKIDRLLERYLHRIRSGLLCHRCRNECRTQECQGQAQPGCCSKFSPCCAGCSHTLSPFTECASHLTSTGAAVTCRYWVGTLDMKEATTRHAAQHVARSRKLSEI